MKSTKQKCLLAVDTDNRAIGSSFSFMGLFGFHAYKRIEFEMKHRNLIRDLRTWIALSIRDVKDASKHISFLKLKHKQDDFDPALEANNYRTKFN